MKTPKSPKANSGSCSVNRLVRHVFSVNVPDENLMDYIEERAALHPKGLSGYVRDLVLVDRAKWQDMEKLRAQALSKLTDNERAALGFSFGEPKTTP